MMQQKYSAACFVSWLRFLSPFGGCAPVYLLDLALLGVPFVCRCIAKSYHILYSTFLPLLHRTFFCTFFYTPRRWAYWRQCSSPTLNDVVIGCWVRVASVCGLVTRYQVICPIRLWIDTSSQIWSRDSWTLPPHLAILVRSLEFVSFTILNPGSVRRRLGQGNWRGASSKTSIGIQDMSEVGTHSPSRQG